MSNVVRSDEKAIKDDFKEHPSAVVNVNVTGELRGPQFRRWFPLEVCAKEL